MTPRVVAETSSFLVLDKPSGLIAHSDGRTAEASVAAWLIETYPELAEVGEAWISPQGERVAVGGMVHRLDRSTSGLLLVAKTPQAFQELRQLFRERRINKTYVAFVHGHLRDDSGSIVAEIMRSSETPRKWYARPCDAGYKRAAVTEWSVIGRLERDGGRYSYVEAKPKTGRTHQIRVHFSSIGHPLVGDVLYGGTAALGFTRPALHAHGISFELSGQNYSFEAALPSDFQATC